MTYAVPNKAKWLQNAQYWYPLLKTATDANPTNDTGLALVYYDAQGCVYAMRDYSGDAVTFSDAMAQSFRSPYFTWVNAGGGQGFRVFPTGPAQDYLRDNSQAGSKSVVTKLATTSASSGSNPWAATSGYNTAHLPDIFYSRETAYTLMALIETVNVGNVGNNTWRDTLKGYALGHIASWLTTRTDGLTKFYLRPFMVALTFKALIQYHEQVSPLSAQNITDMVSLADFIWNSLWNFGNAAASSSFAYTDRATSTMSATIPATDEQSQLVNTGDTESSIDLNQLIVPMFGWCWQQTGDQKWRDRFDTIWNAGLSTYSSLDGHGFWISGAFFGSQSLAGVHGKEIDQSYFWSAKGIAWVEGNPVASPPPSPSGTSAQTFFGLLGLNVYGGGASTAYNVTGQVTYNGVGLAAVTITSVALGNTTTDSNGNYSYANIAPATTYTITPTLAGYTFTPSSTSGTLNANATVSFTAALSTAFDPASYYTSPTKKLYMYLNDTAKVLDASGAVALNNINVKTVNDEWGGTAAGVQATVANQPILKTAIANSKQAIEFTGSPQTLPITNFTGALNSATKVSVFAVFKNNSNALNSTFFRCYDHSFSFQRFRAYLAAGKPSLDLAAADGVTPSTISCTGTALATGTVHAVLFEWDVANSTCQMYVNNSTAIQTTTTAPGTAIANTTLNQPEVGLAASFDLLALSIVTGTLCSNRPNLFADAKTAWGITAY